MSAAAGDAFFEKLWWYDQVVYRCLEGARTGADRISCQPYVLPGKRPSDSRLLSPRGGERFDSGHSGLCVPVHTGHTAAAAAGVGRHMGGRGWPEIRRDDVEKAYRRVAQISPPLSDEEALTAKLSLLNESIVQDILLARARALKIELPDTELDAAYGRRQKERPRGGLQAGADETKPDAADMREGLRRELLAQKVLEREVVSKIAVSDQDVTDFYNANRAQFNFAEDAYRIAQIVITPVRDRQPGNQTGDDATTPQAAMAKTQMLMERLKSGASSASSPETTPRTPRRRRGAAIWDSCPHPP